MRPTSSFPEIERASAVLGKNPNASEKNGYGLVAPHVDDDRVAVLSGRDIHLWSVGRDALLLRVENAHGGASPPPLSSVLDTRRRRHHGHAVVSRRQAPRHGVHGFRCARLSRLIVQFRYVDTIYCQR